MNRKKALSYIGTGLASLLLKPALSISSTSKGFSRTNYLSPDAIFEQTYPFSLPELPFSYSALNNAIDTETMTIHHTKHHQGYVNKLNAALKNTPGLHVNTLLTVVKQWDKSPESVRNAVRNNGSGHLNHTLFWNTLSETRTEPSTNMQTMLKRDFDGYETFTENFSDAASSVFGSGWAWLVLNNQRTLSIITTPNQDNPLSEGYYPILGLDVWEHAYYLNYQNKRKEYIQSWFGLINWNMVERFYQYFNNA